MLKKKKKSLLLPYVQKVGSMLVLWFACVVIVAERLSDNEVSFFFSAFWYCRYHPDKNADDPVASDKFQEATFSYNILSDPDKRRQYDSSGFEVIYGIQKHDV